MKKNFKKWSTLTLILSIIATNLWASTLVKGVIVSKENKEIVAGANIFVKNNPQKGTVSDKDGKFSLNLEQIPATIGIKMLSFQDKDIAIENTSKKEIDLGTIELSSNIINLEEIKIIASFADEEGTPVSVSTINAKTIEQKLGDQTYPEILKQTPGIYATRTGGGSGDAQVSLRGFKQENIALLLNGIPISSVENGLVYWNNWIGLTDATQMIQVQKGLGASKTALNSLGGTINIITKSTEAEKGGSIRHSFTSYGNSKTTFSFSTGIMENGWALTFLGSRSKGDGYVDATYVDAWAYFLSAAKQFGKNHKITVTLLGAPEKHGQRNFMLTQEEVDRYGVKFNTGWGSYNGVLNNASENSYHKPQLNVNHYWNLNAKTFLATSAYISPGKGGGKWSEAFNYGPGLFQFRNPSQQIDWAAVYDLNANHTDTYDLGNGEIVDGFSKIIQTDYKTSHIWTGILSTLEHKFNDKFKLISGIHYRYFKSKFQEKVRDLLGGKFWIDNYAYAIEGAGERSMIKKLGDVINVDNGGIINFGHFFNQLEYKSKKTNAFLAASISKTWYQREDRYNYLTNTKSEVVSKTGWDIKSGINYKLDAFNKIYFNTGFYSKAPLFKFVFPNYNNNPAIDISNEKVFAMEAGYGLHLNKFSFKINAYYTYWKDISFLSKEYIQLENNAQTRALVKGLDALHKGIEMEANAQISKDLNIGLMASIGNWKYKNDVVADLFDNSNNFVETVEVYSNGLKIGNAPQFQFGIFMNSNLTKDISLSIDWTFNDMLYANFDPTERNDATDRKQSFKLPSYHLVDLHLSYNLEVFAQQATFGISCYNLFNTEYILTGEDGNTHSLDTFEGFWGFKRTFNFSFIMHF